MLQPKDRRLIRQVLPFAFMWALYAIVYCLVEGGLMGDLKIYPATNNNYDFRRNFIFTTTSSFFVGLLQGLIEVKWLRKRFEKRSLWVKILLKTFFYSAFIFVFLLGLSTLNSLINFNGGRLDLALEDSQRFVVSFAFWSVMVYIAAILVIAIFFSEISQYFGEGVLYNFIFGKYHSPKKERRIFMFLDMKSSTTIAEQIGHERYFDLLKAYYADMSDAILETSGEIYQYVGDEIVVTWPEKLGVYKNNCIRCFLEIKKALKNKAEVYQKEFGLAPDFKAGYHLGEVTTGEIGVIKKGIIYTGDVLNTTARIQEECNIVGVRLLLSELLLSKLKVDESWKPQRIGELLLRGKKETVVLYSLTDGS